MLERVKSKEQTAAESGPQLLLESARTEMNLLIPAVESAAKQQYKQQIQTKISEHEAELKKIDTNFQSYEAQVARLQDCGPHGEALLKAVKENFSADQIVFYTKALSEAHDLLRASPSTLTEYEIHSYRQLAEQASGAPICCNFSFFGSILRKGISKAMMNIANSSERNLKDFLKQPLLKM